MIEVNRKRRCLLLEESSQCRGTDKGSCKMFIYSSFLRFIRSFLMIFVFNDSPSDLFPIKKCINFIYLPAEK